MKKRTISELQKLLKNKIYKTGQTRGADDDEIYQNRVGRTGTVLIPLSCWDLCAVSVNDEPAYERGFIVLISPTEYFGDLNILEKLASKGLTIGVNALVFY